MKDYSKYLVLYLSITFLLLLRAGTSYCQTDTSDVLGDTTDLNDNAQEELLLENTLEDTEDSNLLDFLENLKNNPYDLNKVTQDDLETIPFISALIAKKIIAFRTKNKSFKSKRQLLKIDGILKICMTI